MAHRDYYNVLGVPRDATQDDIKRAYRKLARRWHPDKNPGRDEVVQRFRDITEAYDALSDPDKRARYDRLGPLYTDDGRPPRPDELNEVVGSVLGNIFRRRRAEPGDDLRYTISLHLEEVATGVDREIVVPRRIRCRACGGDGARSEATRVKCEACGGSGKSRGPRIFRSTCYHCDGKGYAITETCERCDGEGRAVHEDTLRVKVPAGVATGQKLKLAGKGDESKGEADPGDLLVIVNVSDHPLFRRRADDLLVDVPLTFAELSLGGDIEVPTLEGTTTIRVPAATTPGKVFRLPGRGLPRVGRPGRGDLHLQVRLEVPSSLTRAQQAALSAWAADLPPTSHPDRSAFDQLLRDRR